MLHPQLSDTAPAFSPQRNELLGPRAFLSPVVPVACLAGATLSNRIVLRGLISNMIDLENHMIMTAAFIAVVSLAAERLKPSDAVTVLVKRLQASARRKAWLENRMEVLTTASSQNDAEGTLQAAAEKLHRLACAEGGAVVLVSFPPRGDDGKGGGAGQQSDSGAGAGAPWPPPQPPPAARPLVHVAADTEMARAMLFALVVDDIASERGQQGGLMAHAHSEWVGGSKRPSRTQSSDTQGGFSSPLAVSRTVSVEGSSWRGGGSGGGGGVSLASLRYGAGTHAALRSVSNSSQGSGGGGAGAASLRSAVPAETSLSFLRRNQGKRDLVACEDHPLASQRFADWRAGSGGAARPRARHASLAASCLVASRSGEVFCMVVQNVNRRGCARVPLQPAPPACPAAARFLWQ